MIAATTERSNLEPSRSFPLYLQRAQIYFEIRKGKSIQNSICYLLEADQLELACSSYPNAIYYPEDEDLKAHSDRFYFINPIRASTLPYNKINILLQNDLFV